MSVGSDPWSCPCGSEHPNGCPGHVEVCEECGWYGHNLPGRPCVKCSGVVIVRGCRGYPVKGGPVCHVHGGRSPQVARAAKRRIVEAGATKELAKLEYEPVTDPIGKLGELGGQAEALLQLLFARVAEDNDMAAADAVGSMMDRLRKILTAAHRAGLEERRVAVEEAQVELVVAALRLAAERAGLTPTQRQQVIDAWSVAVVELEKSNESANLPSSRKG